MRYPVSIIALALALAATGHAHAAPLLLAIPAFAALSPIAISLISAGISIAAGVGISLLARAIQKKNQPQETAPVSQGVRLDVEMGDTSPLSFCVGQYATAGTRKYINVYGEENGTPNAYLVDVIQVGDLPAPAPEPHLVGLWVNGEKVTLGSTGNVRGRPVAEFNVTGKDHMWVRYHDGTSGEADFYLTNTFGSDPERPWSSDMVGNGTPLVIITTLVNRELFPGQMRFLIEPPVKAFYDLRYDSTNGGSGSQRWGDPSTWQPTSNPAVIIYNLIRGVYYGAPGAEWVFGGQNLPAFRLPAASWIAAANACDEQVALDGGGTEPRYRCGYEVRVDQEPLAVIEELLKACSGRLLTSAGFFKMQIGVPSASVYSFTDADILVTEAQGFDPYPRLEQIHNAIEATYPEPQEGWESKEAPPRYSSGLEEEDGGRRLVASTNFAAAPYAQQVQRLMRAAIEEARRFRVHELVLPPDAAALQPNDVVDWSSDRNGYSAKKFLVVRVGHRRTLNVPILLREIDPNDYDWSTDFELPVSVGAIGAIRPAAQPIYDWSAEGVTDTVGGKQRAAILLSWDGDQDDVARVAWEVRRIDNFEVVHVGGTDSPERGAALISHNIFSGTTYQVRGRYVPGTARPTLWSDWLAVTTPDAPLTDVLVYLENLQNFVRQYLKDQQAYFEEKIASLRARLTEVATHSAEDVMQRQYFEKSVGRAHAQIIRESIIRATADEAFAQDLVALSAEIDASFAAVYVELTAQATAISANASAIIAVEAKTNYGTAQGLLGWSVASAPGGVSGRFVIAGRLTVGGAVTFGGAFFDLLSAGGSRWVFVADQFLFSDGSANFAPVEISGGRLVAKDLWVHGARIDDASITSAKIGDLQVTSAKIGDLEVNGQKIAFGSITETQRDGPHTLTVGTGYTTIAEVTIDNPNGSPIFLQALAGAVGSGSGIAVNMRLVRVGNEGSPVDVRTMLDPIFAPEQGRKLLLDLPGTGTHTYRVQMIRTSDSSTSASGTATLTATLNKR